MKEEVLRINIYKIRKLITSLRYEDCLLIDETWEHLIRLGFTVFQFETEGGYSQICLKRDDVCVERDSSILGFKVQGW